MNDLDRIVERIEAELDEKDRVREATLKATRALTRLAGSALRGMHRGEDVSGSLADARAQVRELRMLLKDHPELWHGGTVEAALAEVAEAAIIYSILDGRPLPDPEELGVPGAAFVLGLADAIGELRRFVLDHMRAGRVEEASRYLQMMEDIFDAILRFDYPNAVVALRRKQDVARSLLERTRGELAFAARGAELERKLGDLAKKL